MFLGEKGWLFTFKVPVHLYRKVSWGPAVLEPSGWPSQVLLWYANFILLESALLQVSCVKIEKKKEVVNFEFGQKTKKEDETKNEEKEEKKEEERRKGRRMFSVLLHWNCNLNACIKSILYLFFFLGYFRWLFGAVPSVWLHVSVFVRLSYGRLLGFAQ